MNIRINKEKLDRIMRERGYSSYYEIEDAAKKQSIELSYRTIYNIAGNNNWTRNSLINLCNVLGCQPGDFVEFTNGDGVHTHESPQSAEAEREQIAA